MRPTERKRRLAEGWRVKSDREAREGSQASRKTSEHRQNSTLYDSSRLCSHAAHTGQGQRLPPQEPRGK